LDKVKEYIDCNKKRPSCCDKNNDVKTLGLWCVCQQKNYRDKINAMKDEDIYIKWESFVKDYEEYFISDDEKWYDNLSKVKEYLNKYHKRPSDKDYLDGWLSSQIQNYKNKNKSMNNSEIYDTFTIFLNEYNEYFRSNEEIWYDKFNKLKEYIDENHKRPSEVDKNEYTASLGKWLSRQLKNYKNRTQIMKDDKIYSIWSSFIEEYKEYFKCVNKNKIYSR
jgi:hypothetical protein